MVQLLHWSAPWELEPGHSRALWPCWIHLDWGALGAPKVCTISPSALGDTDPGTKLSVCSGSRMDQLQRGEGGTQQAGVFPGPQDHTCCWVRGWWRARVETQVFPAPFSPFFFHAKDPEQLQTGISDTIQLLLLTRAASPGCWSLLVLGGASTLPKMCGVPAGSRAGCCTGCANFGFSAASHGPWRSILQPEPPVLCPSRVSREQQPQELGWLLLSLCLLLTCVLLGL